MRRAEIIEGANEILMAITKSQLTKNIMTALPSKGTSDWAMYILSSLKEYAIMASRFSAAAKELVNILEISYLEDTATWTALVDGDEKGRLMILKLHNDLAFVREYLPRFTKMIEPASLKIINKESEVIGPMSEEEAVLTVYIIEGKNRLSSPERVIETLESISTLYRVCAFLVGVPPEGLSVLACDSGSDKSFDFLGAAKVIECLKEFILSLWDRVVFFRERQLEQRIELVNKSLPIYDRLGDLVEQKKLEPERAEILRRDVFEATGKFIKSGATIPEFKEVSNYDPRVLMAPEPKLLVSAPEDKSGDEPADTASSAKHISDAFVPDQGGATAARSTHLDFDNLEDDEREALIRLLNKARQKDDSDSTEDSDSTVSSPNEE